MLTLLHLDLAVKPEWARIDQIREAVGHSVAAVFGDRDLKEALAMVSAELLENAIKYGKPDPAGVRLSVHGDRDRMVVAVTSKVDEGSDHARQLGELVRWVNQHESPLAAYEAALARAFQGSAPSSGLGLARISYEGGCELTCDLSSPGQVTVSAVTRP